MLDNFIAPYESTVTAKLRDAGVVMLGKSNMDEFAMGSSNETSFYGPVKNPWNTAYVPGGSSGGSAAAVAGRLAPAATGTDTGGSIRQPAALCNLTGLKPTYGRVSRYGMIAFASSLDQAGPMAISAEDCALLLNAMAGFDERDSTSVEAPVPDYTAGLNKDIKGLKIGLPREFFGEGLDAGVAKAIEAAIDVYKKAGAKIVEVGLPNMHLSDDAYYKKAQQIRRLISEDFKKAFEKADVIMGPASPTTAFKIGEKTADPVAMYLSDIYTIAVNLAGLPGMSIPAGLVGGLPVGLQLIGNYFDEARLLNVAHQYQKLTDWHLQIPKDFK
jgi:aspartyl-tRNA(Asn)/glutamyl-tRNA(Gln) amidotransferase subunit A